jgi:hypothetical protein
MTLRGDGVRMRVVCGYNPCYNKNPNSSITYQQHRCFHNPRERPHMPANKIQRGPGHAIDAVAE